MAKDTARKKTILSLPEEYRKLIYQPNHISNAHYSFTHLQERLLIYILYHLRSQSKAVREGTHITQLDIFNSDGNKDYVDINIPLRLISDAAHYNDVRAAAVKMQNTQMQITIPAKYGVPEAYYALSLFTHVSSTAANKKTGTLQIRMAKNLVELMLNIEMRNREPINYTTFWFDIAMICDNKYTPRIYTFLSQWKDLRFKPNNVRYMKLEDFREMLQLGDKYPDYGDLKRRILAPAQAEIKRLAEFYFEISETRPDGKTVTQINFIMKERNPDEKEARDWEVIRKTLEKTWRMPQPFIKIVEKIRAASYSADAVAEKIKEAYAWMTREDVMNNPDKRVDNPSKFIYGTLMREFKV